ncbi:MAG TPA: adenylate/guanylate cyclase domain-containing protein [Pirellulaceae bacterium]|nr:adenylate/guanylate cyclase domain-containing protein [Pirellulaceae bacterium]HMO92523.1 adenylate/guanylate cyclase domain-containing protein [Pirellulaceae bacterium]HMP68994.1 adenylate/guanylate cyclase domain-containing protein [Pirellulaceae bacterium]
MADLIAQGEKSDDRWRRQLSDDELVILGRECVGFSIPWDERISRQHARIRLRDGRLKVDRIPESVNPVFYRGNRLDSFWVSPGEHFVIGNTKFTLVAERAFVSIKNRKPVKQQSFKREHLRELRYRDADHRVAMLNQLPDIVARAINEVDLLVRLTTVLLTGIRRASTVAIVEMTNQGTDPTVNVLHWDRRLLSGGDFLPSMSLIREAIECGETTLHVWDAQADSESESASPSSRDFTLQSEGNWAFVVPLSKEVKPPRALYVAGDSKRNSESETPFHTEDLKDDMKFSELVAATLGNLLLLRRLEQRQASLRSFFSPVVLEAIANVDPDDVLRPRECDVSVLFCDLRGFSLTSEQMSDQLYELLDRVSQALGVTTRQILEFGGVVGDFHGDSAMGFWGWPLTQPLSVLKACTAAMRIQREFRELAQRQEHPLRDFQFGMGIATGRAVAGRIGTADQVKVTAFGPVVNLAARLETMTRQLKASILIDEATSTRLKQQLPHDSDILIRRLARIQPFGMKNTFMVCQLMDATAKDSLSQKQIDAYERALDLFLEGNWNEAFELLHQVPASDQAKDLLTVYIAQHHRTPPVKWNGIIEIERK